MRINIVFAILSLSCIFMAQSLLAGWQVDDAAISFSYSKNLSSFGQLSAQLDQVPVEGFSNPLWVLLIATVFNMGFDFHVIPYLCSFLLSATALRIIFFPSVIPEIRLAFCFSGLLIMMQPSILIWSFSGLENPLLLYAGTELLIRCLCLSSGRSTVSNSIVAGLSATVIVLTRPDGVVYIVLYPIITWYMYRYRHFQIQRIHLALAVGIPSVFWLIYEGFRVSYFHAWLPNTYIAKGGLTISRFLEIITLGPLVFMKVGELSRSIFGVVGAFWASVGVIKLVVLAWTRGYRDILIAPVMMLSIATFIYVVLPSDWMGEQRFATLFYTSAYLIITIGIFTAPFTIINRVTLILVFVVISGWYSLNRMHEFIQHPVISIEEVEERSRQFESWETRLGIERASLMTADVGGLLWRNKLIVIDSGMLCDKTIAAAIGEGSSTPDIQKFYDYIFEIKKPDFIATRAYHSWILHLDKDSRFRRDYIPIREYTDIWISNRYGEELFSGDYVRRDRVLSKDALIIIQAEAAKLYYPFCKDCPAYIKPNK